MRKSIFASPIRKFNLTLLALVVAIGLSAGALAADSSRTPTPPPNSNNYDSWLNKEVRHQLVMLPFFSVFDNLAYRVDGTTVTLQGQVVRPVLKGDAEKAVKGLEGVTQVNNQIQVLPLSAFDNQLRLAEFRAIYSKPSLQMYQVRSVAPIHIIVDNGHVALEGAVGSQADKNVAGIAANSVPNVFSVTNNLQVDNGK